MKTEGHVIVVNIIHELDDLFNYTDVRTLKSLVCKSQSYTEFIPSKKNIKTVLNQKLNDLAGD